MHKFFLLFISRIKAIPNFNYYYYSSSGQPDYSNYIYYDYYSTDARNEESFEKCGISRKLTWDEFQANKEFYIQDMSDKDEEHSNEHKLESEIFNVDSFEKIVHCSSEEPLGRNIQCEIKNETDKTNPRRFNRVVDGLTTRQYQYPWLVALQTKDGRHYCAGSILTNRWVLTGKVDSGCDIK